MKRRLIFLSVIFAFSLLTGCYTSFATVKHYRTYENEEVYYDEDDVEIVAVYHNYRPYYPTRFVYYDPYDSWYNEPVLFISIGYEYHPHYYITYYPYGGCIYPPWYPVVWYPYYTPAWHHDHYAHHGYRDYYDYKKRDFAKRRNLPGRDYGRRDRKSNRNKELYADTDYKFGRQIINRGGSQISDNKGRTSSGRSGTIAKRKSDDQKPRPIKTRNRYNPKPKTNDKRDIYDTKRASKRVDQNKSNTKKSTPKIVRRKSGNNGKVEDTSNNKNNSRNYIRTTRKSNDYILRRTNSSKPSTSSRPKISEKSKNTSSNSSRNSRSSESSYKPSRSSSKSSASSSRATYKSNRSSSKSTSSSSHSSYKPGRSSSKSSSRSSGSSYKSNSRSSSKSSSRSSGSKKRSRR